MNTLVRYSRRCTAAWACLWLLASLNSEPVQAGDDFPAIYDSEQDASARPPSPEDSLQKLSLPKGFHATIFAAEPDVQNPIAMAWDGRGRLWVAENYTYAEPAKRFDLQLRDRILIFEDTDGDGRHDKRHVFADDVQQLTSVEVGHGGVWALCPPRLLFIPDANCDDVPDGPAQVVLDGFNVPQVNYHNFANGLRWGPDGWLYGRCGASAPGELGVPGTPDADRKPLRGGMWRYHPERRQVEVVSAGPVNSWGHDWNEHGELFGVNTVGGHLWHVFPGAHYRVLHTIDANPHAYDLIDMHADHWHFDVDKGWTNSRDGVANQYGGGHAHAGTMVYQGDNWPAELRGRLFTLNFFGRRANEEILERSGSGYVGKHAGDKFLFGDNWFRGLDLAQGPDGSVYVLDWCDTGECHEHTGVSRSSGRIYKISYGNASAHRQLDLARHSDADLVELQRSSNEWLVRQARLQLADRSGGADSTAAAQLRKMFRADKDSVIQLRALWALNAIESLDDATLRAALHHADEHIRTWAVRLLTDSWPLDTVVSKRAEDAPQAVAQRDLDELCAMAASDPSGLVCLTLASTLQRLPFAQRAPLAAPLVARGEFADDHNLPLLIWYGLIPLGDAAPEQLASLGAECQLPLTRRFIARRLGEKIDQQPEAIDQLLTASLKRPEDFQLDVLAGLSDACRGLRKAAKPASWNAVQASIEKSPNEVLRNRVRHLSVIFGDGLALDSVRRMALDDNAELSQRRTALETLIANRPDDLREICERLLGIRYLNVAAAKGLTLFDDDAIGKSLVEHYPQFHNLDRPAVIDSLASRPSFAGALLDAVAAGDIPRSDVTPFHARQMFAFNDSRLNERLTEVWGQVRDSTADKQALIAKWKTKLDPAVVAAADKSAGRAVFNAACASCHRLYGAGDPTGLDLTGSGRDNLDFLLNNILDPAAVVNADFRLRIVDLEDGRTLTGVVVADNGQTITLKTVRDTVTIDRTDIDDMRTSDQSLMPDGLLESLAEEQVRNLIAYLMHTSQTPLPAAAADSASSDR